MAQKMDRGSDACKAHLGGTSAMEIRQTRRGCLQELCCPCEARSEFKYYVGNNHVATSLEDSSCICRWCCKPCRPYTMVVKENNTEAEILTIDRPCKCAAGPCKCCCYQAASFTSGGQALGSIKEDCYWCVPSFTISDSNKAGLYVINPPTCCGGVCINCCAEGNPCGKGCCRQSFRVYPYAQKGSTNGDAPYIGTILKKPKSAMVEIFTDANAFDVSFPEGAGTGEKAVLVGTTIFLDAIFFEGGDSNGGGADCLF